MLIKYEQDLLAGEVLGTNSKNKILYYDFDRENNKFNNYDTSTPLLTENADKINIHNLKPIFLSKTEQSSDNEIKNPPFP